MERLSCLVCDRTVPPGGAHRPAYFDDVCICRECLDAQRDGHGRNAERVRQQLARQADRSTMYRPPA